MLTNDKCALWAGVGLGKTVTALTAISNLLETKSVQKILVIAPLRVAKFVWPQEIDRWDHLKHLKCTVLHGTAKKRKELLAAPAPRKEKMGVRLCYFRRIFRFQEPPLEKTQIPKNGKS